MIKVYDSTEKIFDNNGIKILKPLFAQITKKDNSDYYLELEDTINNINYYQKGLIIRTTTPWGVQGFRCDNPKIENNRIKCKAWHLTYDSKNYIVKDSNSVDKNCSAALYHFNSGTDTPSPFTTISDIETILSCRMVRKSLFQVFNELIDETKYGGHLYRDNFVFGIKSSIGEDRGVVLATNKNITGMSVNENWDDVCTKILPYTTDGQKVIALDDVYVSLTEQLYDLPYSKVVKFENPYKEEDYDDRNSFEVAVKTWLKSTAMTYLEKNKLPKVNYTVEAQINNVSDVGDVIRVKHSKCNIDIITNVISITYDCIRSKYVKIEFGNFKKEIKNLTQQITEEAQKYSDGLVLESNTYMKNELLAATSKINAVLGNSFVIYDGDKILIVNKLPKEEATDVIKISNGGIGFSRDGINGTFKSAWTIDGNFCADFITTGKINTDLIEGYSNLELAVQNSLLSITPQYSIEGTDLWSDTIPNVDTWQRILTRNKYVRTDGQITYSKVIPYVEGMNNLINYIEGTDVSIYNSNDDEMELKSIVLDGKSIQQTRSGKNLYKYGDISDNVSSGYYVNHKLLDNFENNTTYTISFDITSSVQPFRISIGYGDDAFQKEMVDGTIPDVNNGHITFTFTTDNTTYSNLWIRAPRYTTSTTYTTIISKIMLEKGNKATEYENYGVSPSPDYPSEVENINTIEIKNVGKNLLDYKTVTPAPSTSVKLIDNGFKAYGTQSYGGIVTVSNLKTNTDYYLQYITENIVGTTKYVLVFPHNATSGSLKSFGNGVGGTFNTGSNTSIDIWFYCGVGTTSEANFTNIQVEEGTTLTNYQPYQENTLNIDLQGNELCSLPNNVKDELVIENGKAKIIKNVGKAILNGSENWIVSNKTYYTQLNNKKSNKIFGDNNLISDYFKQTSQMTSTINLSTGEMTESYYSSGNLNIFFNYDNGIGGVDNFKTWLSTHNTKVYYELATSTEIDLGEVEITKLFSKDNNITNSEHTNMLVGYYTDYTFYKTVLEQYAKIDLNNDNINIELAKKTNSKDIIATINMSTEKDEDGSVIQINSDKLNLKNKVFNLDTENITIKSPNFNVDKNGNISVNNGSFKGNIYLPSGGYVLGGNGLLTVLKFESNIRSAQFLGANNFLPLYYSGANNIKDFLEFDFDIPDNFTILSAYVKLEHMPVNHNEISSGSLGTGYCRNLKLYKAKSMTSGSVDMNWSFGSTGYSNIEFNEITGAFGTNGFTGSSAGYTSQKSIDLKAYISTGNNIFKIETSDGFTQGDYSKYGAARATLYVYGYTNVS